MTFGTIKNNHRVNEKLCNCSVKQISLIPGASDIISRSWICYFEQYNREKSLLVLTFVPDQESKVTVKEDFLLQSHG